MKQQHTLIYFISGLLIFLGVSVNAQNGNVTDFPKDSLVIKENYGLRIGADLSKLARSFYDDEYSGFEVMADFRLKKKLYLAGELGFEERNTVTNYLDITTTGSYLKGGIDYNSYQNWLDMDNMIYFGFRVGASSFSHDRNSFTIYSTNQFWAPQLSSSEIREFNGLTAFWAEIILGLKVELLNNLYLGLNVQLKILATETKPDDLENVYIPGFGKTYDSSSIGAGYSYLLSYRIPLYQKTK